MVIFGRVSMSNLHFHYGAMAASKSAQLIMTAYNLRRSGNNVDCIKPKIDNRYSDTKIQSRIGISTDAFSLDTVNEYLLKDDVNILLIDEIQFFPESDIDILVDWSDNKNKLIMCYGLLVDYNGRMFETSKRLIESGAKLHNISSNCQIDGCMALADHHLLFDKNGCVVHGDNSIVIGDGCYKSVCRRHFNQFYNKTK